MFFNMFKRPKLFKVRTLNKPQKYGLASRNLAGLLQKACKQLKLPSPGCRICLYEDGTELTESYFASIPDNTEVVLLTAGEAWQGYVSDIDQLLKSFYKQQDDLVEAAQKLLSDEQQGPKRQKILVDLIQNLNENILAETRDEDRQWFEGIGTRFKNKSAYMAYNCESRIRGYMREVESHASTLSPKEQVEYKQIAELMWNHLKSVKFNGCYFNRKEEENRRICTSEGWFSCQGAFDADDCGARHSINPYSNYESRVVFSTWNLDHKIEKKRTIVPTLAKAVKEQNGREVNWEYFYQLLFTLENLKLVHITCHKKTSHNLACDDARIYKKRAKKKAT
ncbi:DNA fragmentation factor subunit beta [Lissotriton helveticus]